MEDLIIIQYQLLTEKGIIENDNITIEATEENKAILEQLKEASK